MSNDNNEKPALPFFARFLEGQELDEVVGARGARTLKYPSDADEAVTMKYPSDDDETIKQ